MAWTAPTTRSTGALISASIWNTDLVDNLAYLKNAPTFDGAITATTSVTTPSVTNAGTLALSATGANVITAATNGSERVRITSTGLVGIGTTVPNTALDVTGLFGTSTSAATIYNSSASAAGNIARVDFRLNNTFSGTGPCASITGLNPNAANNNGGALAFATAANGSNTTPTERMRIAADGSVGIGTTSPSEALHVVGNIRNSALLGGATTLSCDANANIIRTPSDARLKVDIETLTDCLAKVTALRPVRHGWRDTHVMGEGRTIGLIAQDVAPVVPEVVSVGGDGTYSVNYPLLTALLIGAVQELTARVAALEA